MSLISEQSRALLLASAHKAHREKEEIVLELDALVQKIELHRIDIILMDVQPHIADGWLINTIVDTNAKAITRHSTIA